MGTGQNQFQASGPPRVRSPWCVWGNMSCILTEPLVSNFFGLSLVFSLCVSRGGIFRSASPVGFRRYDQNTHTYHRQTHTWTHTQKHTHHTN